MGRTKITNRRSPLTAHLTPGTRIALSCVAKEKGTTKSKLVEQAIHHIIKTHAAKKD